MTYTVSLGRVLAPLEMWKGGLVLEMIAWTEPVTYDGDRDEVEAIVHEIMAAHPEFARAKVEVNE